MFFFQQLAALLISRQVIGNLKESVLPYILEHLRLAKMSFELWGALSPSGSKPLPGDGKYIYLILDCTIEILVHFLVFLKSHSKIRVTSICITKLIKTKKTYRQKCFPQLFGTFVCTFKVCQKIALNSKKKADTIGILEAVITEWRKQSNCRFTIVLVSNFTSSLLFYLIDCISDTDF